jgi:putative N6-adenine-specific DNA methylase
MPPNPRLAAYVVAAPGLEPLVLDELARLGVRDGKLRRGGVGCTLTWPQLGLTHLHLRIATRVLVRLARFPAHSWRELEQGLRDIDWSAWLPPTVALSLRVASTGSTLFHEGAIEERALAALARRVGEGPPATLYLRVQHDMVTVSLDATGEPLHKRGWRLAVDDAPLRETLAAALVAVSGWDRKAPLVDPCCGSGTIAIEAAMTARKMPPGRHRSFAFQAWPRADEVRYDTLCASADSDVLTRKLAIVASDTSSHAVAAATANAARAGVGDAVELRTGPAAELVLPSRPGWIVSNPPYGDRIRGAREAGRQLAVLIARAPGWRGALIAPATQASATLRAARPVPPAERMAVSNGGIDVQLVAFAGTPAPDAA